MFNKGRWVAVVASLVVVGLVVGVFVSVGVSLPAKKSDLPTVGPTANELEQLAADLSSGKPDRILASIADLPPGAEKDVLKTLLTPRFATKRGVVIKPRCLLHTNAHEIRGKSRSKCQ